VSRIDELERRVQQDPASIVFGALAEEYRRAGRLDEAVAACRSGLERHPAYLSARVTLGRALQELSRSDEARAEFEYVISLAPDNLAAIRALAELQAPASAVAPALPASPASPASHASPALEAWLSVLVRERESAHDRL
jgi:tetratricopeptide (TPR) repeat protein